MHLLENLCTWKLLHAQWYENVILPETSLQRVDDDTVKTKTLSITDSGNFAIGNPERHVRRALHRGSKQQ